MGAAISEAGPPRRWHSAWKAIVLSYYAVSFVGTAANCYLWIEFSREGLNILWLVGIPVAGFAVELLRLWREGSERDAKIRRIHVLLCGIIVLGTLTWPGVIILTGLNIEFSWGPPNAPLVALLPLAPYGVALLKRIVEFLIGRFGWLSALGYGLGIVTLIPSLAVLALWAFGSFFLAGDHSLVAEEVVPSPNGLWMARHEYRKGLGGAFPDALGRIWVESKHLPLRQLVCRYAIDKMPPFPKGVVQWKVESGLRISLPDEAVGEETTSCRWDR